MSRNDFILDRIEGPTPDSPHAIPGPRQGECVRILHTELGKHLTFKIDGRETTTTIANPDPEAHEEKGLEGNDQPQPGLLDRLRTNIAEFSELLDAKTRRKRMIQAGALLGVLAAEKAGAVSEKARGQLAELGQATGHAGQRVYETALDYGRRVTASVAAGALIAAVAAPLCDPGLRRVEDRSSATSTDSGEQNSLDLTLEGITAGGLLPGILGGSEDKPKAQPEEPDTADKNTRGQNQPEEKGRPAENQEDKPETSKPALEFSAEKAIGSFWHHLRALQPFIDHAYENPNLALETKGENGQQTQYKINKEILTIITLASANYASGGYVMAQQPGYVQNSKEKNLVRQGLLAMTEPEFYQALEAMDYDKKSFERALANMGENEQKLAMTQAQVEAAVWQTHRLVSEVAVEKLTQADLRDMSDEELVDFYAGIAREYARLKYGNQDAAKHVGSIVRDSIEVGMGKREGNKAMYALYQDPENKKWAEAGKIFISGLAGGDIIAKINEGKNPLRPTDKMTALRKE